MTLLVMYLFAYFLIYILFSNMWETRVRPLGQEDTLAKRVATHFPIEYHGQRSLKGYSH